MTPSPARPTRFPWGEALAGELVGRLARHGAEAVPLAQLEPDLDPNIHHTNVPIAIVVRAIEQRDLPQPKGPEPTPFEGAPPPIPPRVVWFHVLAIVEGRMVRVDGPMRTEGVSDVQVASADDLDALASRLDEVASEWLGPRREELGVTDATLGLTQLLRARGDTWWMYVTGGGRGLQGRVMVRRDRVRWPAAVAISPDTDGGVRIGCGDAIDRSVRTFAELAGLVSAVADELARQVARCETYVIGLADARTAALAALPHVERAYPTQSWSVFASEYFRLDQEPVAMLNAAGFTGATAWFVPDEGGVHLRCNGGAELAFADATDLEARVDELVSAIGTALTAVSASHLLPKARYRVRRHLRSAGAGRILTFEEIQERRPSGHDFWVFSDGVVLEQDAPELDALGDYLELIVE